MKRILILIFFLFLIQVAVAQDSLKTKFAVQANWMYQPSDFFANYGFSVQHKKFIYTTEFGFGIRSTLFQSHFTPRFSNNFGLNFKLISWLELQPEIRAAYSVQRIVIANSRLLIQNLQTYLAGKIILGRKNACFIASGIGPAWQWNSNVSNQNSRFFHWDYLVEIGYRYAF